ncbi:MAG: phage tail tape measure protein, partial [Planctomycetota bacterium]
MNRVEAVLVDAATGNMPALTAQARELGETTAFSARQAAEGMGFLAQAGFSAQQILSAMPGTLTLAAAGQIDLAEAADISTGILSGYRLGVDQTGRAVDVISRVTSKAKTDVTQLGEAMKIAGPIAAGMNIPFEETVAVIGALGNGQIQASLAGTALRGALSRLANPPAEAAAAFERLGIAQDDIVDSTGNVRSLVDVIDLLGQRGAITSDLLTIFGDRAGPAMITLLGQGPGPIRELQAALESAGGAAQRMSDTQLQGAPGAIVKMQSAFEGLLIAIASSGLLESFTSVTVAVTGLLGELAQTNPMVLEMATYALLGVAAIGPLLIVVGQMAIGMSAIWPLVVGLAGALKALAIVTFTTVVPAVWSFTTALLANPITWIIGLVAGLGYGLYKLATSNTIVGKGIRDVWNWVADGLGEIFAWIADAAAAVWDALPDWLTGLFGSSGTSDVRVSVTDGSDRFLDPSRGPIDRGGFGPPGAGAVSLSESRVRVDFSGLPDGAAISTEGSFEGVDLEVGPAMGVL